MLFDGLYWSYRLCRRPAFLVDGHKVVRRKRNLLCFLSNPFFSFLLSFFFILKYQHGQLFIITWNVASIGLRSNVSIVSSERSAGPLLSLQTRISVTFSALSLSPPVSLCLSLFLLYIFSVLYFSYAAGVFLVVSIYSTVCTV